YSKFYVNTNCISHGKVFGTIQRNNDFVLLVIKYFLALQYHALPDLIGPEIYNYIIQKICIVITSMLFFYMAYYQLIKQPYYSSTVNNYKFAVYFSLGLFSFYTFILCILKANSSSIIPYISVVILIFIFIASYCYNQYYKNSIIKRVFKKFKEKNVVHNLRKTLSTDELKFCPDNLEKKDVYKSIERITSEKYIRKEIKIYNNYYECEVVCRFLRQLYIIAWYYINTMRNFYKDNELLSNYNPSIFNNVSILQECMQFKLKIREKFLLNNAEHSTEKEKREVSNLATENINMSYHLDELKNEAVTTHIHGLKEIKSLFNNLRRNTAPKHILPYITNINEIYKYQKLANNQYKNIIRQYHDARVNEIKKKSLLFL
ncbi:hypothetical protein BCR36DRAFT_299255, partial [Piromyces finnis]